MTTKNEAPAGANGERIGHEAQAGGRAHQGSSTVPAPLKAVEVRTRLSSGETVVIRVADDDPNWRQKALAGLDDLSPLAFAIRRAPQTTAEKMAWSEYCRKQDLIDELRDLAASVREFHSALLELEGLA